ncbi:MAG: hypothetical protein ACI9MR_000411 [Myxococcota bacterium]|jgi:hypothetical protein
MHSEPRKVKMRCYLGTKKVGDFDSHNRYDLKVADYKKKGADPVRTAWGKYVFHVKQDFGKGLWHWKKPTVGEAKEGSTTSRSKPATTAAP